MGAAQLLACSPPDSWAHAAGIPLATAIVFTDELVALRLAEHVEGNVYRLTERGVHVVSAMGAFAPFEERS